MAGITASLSYLQSNNKNFYYRVFLFMKYYDKINQIEKRKIAKKCTKVMDENFATNYLTDTCPDFKFVIFDFFL